MRHRNPFIPLLGLVLGLVTIASPCRGATDTAFTYHGELWRSGDLAEGAFALRFRLFDAASGGSQIGPTLGRAGVAVTSGRFSVELDFGANAFDGSDRWLAVEVEGQAIAGRQRIAAAPRALRTRGVEVAPNGNVGIKTTAPANKLHVAGELRSDGGFTAGDAVSVNIPGSVTEMLDVDGNANISGRLSCGDGFFWSDPAAGFVGVGRTSRLNSTEVFGIHKNTNGFGGMYAKTSGSPGLPFYGYSAGGDVDAYHYFDGSDGKWKLWAGDTRLIVGGASPKLEITGDLRIGAPEQGGSLGIVGQAGPRVVWYYDMPGDRNAKIIFEPASTWFHPEGGPVGIATTGLPGFTLHVNGSAGKPGGGSWSNSSDARLKKNIANLDGALDKLLDLRGVTFEYIDPPSIHERSGAQVGMIAQDVERVFPDWVDTGASGYKTLTYRGFEALVVEALRDYRAEKDAELDALAQRLAALEPAVGE